MNTGGCPGRDELAARIEAIARAESRPRARRLARDLEPWIGALDVALREKLVIALASWSLDVTPARGPASLGVGEAWLLLHAGGRDGHVARLRARARAGDLSETLTSEVELAIPLRALARVAARACRKLPGDIEETIALEVCGPAAGSFGVVGRSFHLAAAAALLSRALRRAADPTRAGSACVGPDGVLLPVEHLDEKVSALRRDFPDVRTVVVATGQALPPRTDVKFVEAPTLADGLVELGLDHRQLPASLLDDHADRARLLSGLSMRPHSTREWRRHSIDAEESAIALAEHDPTESGECRAWAALFALHAGDTSAAQTLLDGHHAQVRNENPALDAWMHIIAGTTLIDRDQFLEAAAEATVAVEKCASLERRDRSRLTGQALGTHGRALMHAGRWAEAETSLRRSVEHHRAEAPGEVPRSLCYLATCSRLAGRPDQALDIVEEAVRLNEPNLARHATALATVAYLRLERGRILIELVRYEEAEADLLEVAPRHDVATYPRLGAERSLVRLRLAREEWAPRARQAFARCVQAARLLLDDGRSVTLARVAAIGLAEGIERLELATSESQEAASLWERSFGTAATPSEFERARAKWIY